MKKSHRFLALLCSAVMIFTNTSTMFVGAAADESSNKNVGVNNIEISNPIASTANDDDTFTNPVIWADVPDVDVIRVGDVYYMSSTTMHLSPGCPIMKSYDLVNWETVNYVYDTLADNDALTLKNGANNGEYAYGKGSWASSLRYNNGIYYCTFMSYTTGKTYIYQTTDIENGEWKKSELADCYHDMSLLFDDDGKIYMVYGGVPLRIIELEIVAGIVRIKQGGLNKILIDDASMDKNKAMTEGAHIYKKNGYYYIFLISIQEGRRIQLCYRSTKIDGPYEGKIVLSDSMGFYNAGVAQGGIVDTKDGDWYAMLFQDHGAVGRVPVLVPMTWEDNWPVLGVDGKVPTEMAIPVPGQVKKSVVSSDEFDKQTLGLDWQWNHNPDNDFWSLTQREGYMRLTTGSKVTKLTEARNTLTQRTFGPECSGTVALEVGNMKNGDVAGVAAFAEKYGYIAVKMKDGVKSIVMVTVENKAEKEIATVPLEQNKVYFKIDFNFDIDSADFWYSYDGVSWEKLGSKLSMEYYGLHFMGYRFAMFNYATQSTGGYVDFDYYHVDDKLTDVVMPEYSEAFLAELKKLRDSIDYIDSDKNPPKLVLDTEFNNNNPTLARVTSDYWPWWFGAGSNATVFIPGWVKNNYKLSMAVFAGYNSNDPLHYFGAYPVKALVENANVDWNDNGVLHYCKTGTFEIDLVELYKTISMIEAFKVMTGSVENGDERLITLDAAGTEAIKKTHVPNYKTYVNESGGLTSAAYPQPADAEKVKVMFDLNYTGSTGAPASQEIVKDSTIAEPTAPKRSGYTFNGWFTKATGGTKIVFPYKVIGNVTLYAQWERVSETVEPKTPAKPVNQNNPLISQRYSADPTSIEHNGRVYVYSTNDDQQFLLSDKNNYDKINTLNVFSTDDMVNWTDHGILDVKAISPWITTSWAPSIVKREEADGKTHFYLFYAVNGYGTAVLTSTDPLGPWEDKVGKELLLPWADASKMGIAHNRNLFDPGAFCDDDGNIYVACGAGGDGTQLQSSFIFKMNKDVTDFEGSPVYVNAPYFNEAGELNKIGGKYIYSYNSNWSGLEQRTDDIPGYNPSPGLTGCSMEYMISDNPMGPYTYKDYFFTNPGTWAGFGNSNNHTHLQDFGGKWYIIYHTLHLENLRGESGGFRSVMIDEIKVNADSTIEKTVGTKNGVEQIKNLNPFVLNRAATMCTQAGITTKALVKNGDTVVTDIHSGDWVLVKGVDFDKGASKFTANVKGKGIVDIRIDGLNSQTVGSVSFDTADFTNVTNNIDKITGVHDVYFVFDGNDWSFDSWQFSTPTPTYTINFITDGGSAVAEKLVVVGDSLSTSPVTTKNGYTFVGWYSDSALSNLVLFPYTPTTDVVLYAKWKPSSDILFEVIFNSQGGSDVAKISNVVANSNINAPIAPTRSGYTFNGWFTAATGGTKITFPYTVTENVTLYAQWKTVSSSGNGGGGGGSGGTNTSPTTPTISTGDISKITDAKPGDTIIIDTKNITEIPSSVMDLIKGVDKNIMINYDDVSIKVNGKDLKGISGSLDVDVKISSKNKVISAPTQTIKETTGSLPTAQLKIGKGTTQQKFDAEITINCDKAAESQNAVLLKWNETTKAFEFVSKGVISSDGKATAKINGTGEYTVITIKTGDIDKDGKISANDATGILKSLIGTTTLDPLQKAIANSTGKAPTTADAANLLKFLVGLVKKI